MLHVELEPAGGYVRLARTGSRSAFWLGFVQNQESVVEKVQIEAMSLSDPALIYPDYKSTRLRGPKLPLIEVPGLLDHVPAPKFSATFLKDKDADLTVHGKTTPLGERMVLHGKITDESGAPVRNALVEIWQANASGRYDHPGDQHDAPLDPNFHGAGKTLTDNEGYYRFITIRPGTYPWRNHAFAWRPAHVHFSLFGNAYAERLITQMYFPGDPFLNIDPIYQSLPLIARDTLISELDLEAGIEEVMTGYRFDIVLGGAHATPTGI